MVNFNNSYLFNDWITFLNISHNSMILVEKKLNKIEPAHLLRNKGSSEIIVTDQPEVTSEQQTEM